MAERRGTIFLLLGMLAWIVAGFAGAAIAAAIAGIGTGVVRVLIEPASSPSPVIFVLIAACGFQGTLLLAALRQGKLAGNGDRWVGLGAGPIQRQGVVTLLCAAVVVWLACFIVLLEMFPALREFAKSVTPDVLAGSPNDGLAIVLARVGLVVLLAPVSEELFFRGWLWGALCRRGQSVVVTACLTGGPWLLLHGLDAPGRIVFLIPATVIFSAARSLGGGVRASLATHMTNNMTAVILQALSVPFGSGQ